MKSKQIAILGVAAVAALGAGYLAMNMSKPEPVIVEREQAPAPKIETAEVLVAKADLTVGARIDTSVRWQEWPKDVITEGLITKSAEPEAAEEIKDWVVRNIIYKDEPIRKSKLLGPGQRFMSSLLPSGKRAIAVQVSAATSAGGFILPNDFVDLVMVRRDPAANSGGDGYLTETILENIRVLAIDQTIVEDEEGNKTKIGETATLELTPQQVEIVSVAQQMADRLSLSLRSIADINDQIDRQSEHLLGKGQVKVIKSGQISVVGGG